MDSEQQQEYHVRPRYRLALWLIVCMWLLGWGWLCWLTVIKNEIDDVVAAVVFLTVTFLGSCFMAYLYLQTLGMVVTTPTHLTVTNWRGQKHTVPWGEIITAKLYRWRPGIMDVYTLRMRIRIPAMVENQDKLADEVITKAKLQLLRRRFVSIIYKRSS
jgi:hypothetical protein